MAANTKVYEIKDVTGKPNNRTGRFFKTGSHSFVAEVSNPQPKELMIYQNGGNGQSQQSSVHQLTHRGREKTRGFGGLGSGASSGYSSRDGSATPTLSDDGSRRQQKQSQNRQQDGVHTVRITNQTINGTGIEQPNIVLIDDDIKKPIDATIDNNTASAGKQYNVTGSAKDVLELMKILKGMN